MDYQLATGFDIATAVVMCLSPAQNLINYDATCMPDISSARKVT